MIDNTYSQLTFEEGEQMKETIEDAVDFAGWLFGCILACAMMTFGGAIGIIPWIALGFVFGLISRLLFGL